MHSVELKGALQRPDSAIEAGLRLLNEIGGLLDVGGQPYVHENGLVMPGPDRCILRPGTDKESRYASEPEPWAQGPAPREREGTAIGRTSSHTAAAGSASRAASAGAEALILGPSGLTAELRRDLGEAIAAYPAGRVLIVPPVVWLLTPVRPILGLPDQAWLLTRIGMDSAASTASWAWWDVGLWIGPRHTNVPDGSICAFERSDGTWRPEMGLTLWLDLHATWIVRHLHLRYVGRWPGSQVLHTAAERLRDHRPGEFCGCRSGRLYAACCSAADLAMSPYARAYEFWKHFREGIKRPNATAAAVLQKMICDQSSPPILPAASLGNSS
jgi:hypothetical protein